MALSPAQRAQNLTKICAAAAAVEKGTRVPAELCVAQCILESGWLAQMPADSNNPFGIKARAGQPFASGLTIEYLRPPQLAALQAKGVQIQSVGPLINGKHKVVLVDRFAAFTTLEAAFLAYAELMVKGKYFAARFGRYCEHKDLRKLLSDMKGADGFPPYATDPSYDTKILQLCNQSNVKSALTAARAEVFAAVQPA